LNKSTETMQQQIVAWEG